jgi:hypothetical protein
LQQSTTKLEWKREAADTPEWQYSRMILYVRTQCLACMVVTAVGNVHTNDAAMVEPINS